MDDKEWKKYINDPMWQIKSKIVIQQQQFEMWLKKLFYLNDALHKEYDLFYQELFIVILFQTITEGYSYLVNNLNTISKTKNKYWIDWHKRLIASIGEIKSKFTSNEFAYLEYRRHNACHIFQNGYEIIQDNGTIKKERRITDKSGSKYSKDLQELELDFFKVLDKYSNDKGYDDHFRSLLYPIINQLYLDLQKIHNDELNEIRKNGRN